MVRSDGGTVVRNAERRGLDSPPVPTPALTVERPKHPLEVAELLGSSKKKQESGMPERSSCAMTTAPWQFSPAFQGQTSVQRARLEPRRAA